ncbi:MAG: acyltransferase [Oleispira sp.]
MLYCIQYLRAIAALMVVFYHFMNSSVFQGVWYPWVSKLDDFLSVGVDIFFVLSGFIISLSVFGKKNVPFSRKRFFLSRLIRVYPTYWIFFITLLAVLSLPIVSANIGSFSYVLKSFFLIPVFNHNSEFYPFLFVGWSLVFELYFYLLFMMTYHKSPKVMMLSLLSSLVILSMLADHLSYLPLKFLLQSNLVFEFFIGCVIYVLYNSKVWMTISNVRTIVVLGGSMLVFIVCLIDEGGPFAKACFSVYLLIVFLLINQSLKKYHLFADIGDASYTLYLSHSIALLFFSGLWKRGYLIAWPGFEFLSVVISVLCCVCFALLFYKKVEQPLIMYLNKQSGLYFERSAKVNV